MQILNFRTASLEQREEPSSVEVSKMQFEKNNWCNSYDLGGELIFEIN